MPTLTFTTGNDIYDVVAAGDYDLTFLAGDDTLTVRGGTFTTAHMGDGNDVAFLKSSDALVFGDAGNDRFEIYNSNFEARGGFGSDLFNIRGGSTITALGEDDDDRFNFYGNALNVFIQGGAGNDDFFGYEHSVSGSLFGNAGNDYFVGFSDLISIFGGAGNDIYRATVSGPPILLENVGEGTDSVQVARGATYVLPDNIENISVQGFHGTTTADASLYGNALANTINGHANNEGIWGYDGNDRLFGKGGIDTLQGGNGNDYLDGGDGIDQLAGNDGNDTLQGRAGNDSMQGNAGDDTYYVDDIGDNCLEAPGEGTDTVRVSVSANFYTLSTNVENGIVSGSAGVHLDGNSLDNTLIGNAGNDTLSGWSGHDTIRGGAGDDALNGGSGDDVLNGGAGTDTMSGGTGDDRYYVDAAGDTVDETGGDGTDTVYVAFSGYTLGTDIEDGTLLVSGQLTGNALANRLTGSAGQDALYGGDGNDTFFGGTGGDILAGEAGTDLFYYTSVTQSLPGLQTPGAADAAFDTLSGFGSGEVIDLSAIDANTTLAGDQAFATVGAPSGAAGELWLTGGGGLGGWYVHADVDGGGADFQLFLSTGSIPTPGWFVL